MSKSLRWGILGTGNIAAKFASQLPETDSASLQAVGSRSADSAKRFAGEHGGTAHGSYQGVLDDDDVDAVYLALPNDLHEPWTLAALAAGKHVLCEKPLAWSEDAARRMHEAAEQADRVLVEAFMYRLHPGIAKLIDLVREGAIGPLKLIRAHFTFNRPASTADGRYHFDKGGGGLLDVGCYCINLARALTEREPDEMAFYGHRHEHGVDDYGVGILRFGDVLANFGCGMTVQDDRATTVFGADGSITLEDTWINPAAVILKRGDKTEIFKTPALLPPYALEVASFAKVVAGEAEPWITPADSIAQARVLQTLRDQFADDIAAVG